MESKAKIFVTGHRGMVGSAIVRRLQTGGHTNILTRTHSELDLLDLALVRKPIHHSELIRRPVHLEEQIISATTEREIALRETGL